MTARLPPAKLTLGENLLLLAWAMITLALAYSVVAPTLLVIFRYGLPRVVHDHLHILAMPKHQPWPVSNGDVIPNGGFVHYVLGLVSWFTLIFATYPLIRLVLPRRR
jgi:hypothetical protein